MIIFILSCLLLISLVRTQFIQPGLCDIRCHCPPGEAVVDCNHQDQLQGVPTNIGRDVTKLYIQDGDFPSPSILTRANMSGLEQLEHLSIIYCKLQAIESKTFLGMNKLKHLDLSRNSLRQLDPYTFFGLQLINLYLQEQHSPTGSELYLSKDTFNGLAADQINLRGNKFTKVEYSWFANVNNLHRLILSDNRITWIDIEFSKHFNGPSYLLDLTGNQLECNCDLVWIALLSATWADSLPGVNLTCIYQSTPHKINVVELRRLSADHLCPRSRIKHIDVAITDMAKRAILDCTAITIPKLMYNFDYGVGTSIPTGVISYTPPEVAWQYIEGGHLREVRRLPKESSNFDAQWRTFPGSGSSLREYPSSTVRLNVSLDEDPKQYKCTTRNKQNDAEEVVVALRGPSRSVPDNQIRNTNAGAAISEKVPIKSMSKADGQNQAVSTHDERDFLSRPRFSPIEMIVAVCGTFLSTSVLLFIIAFLWHRCTPACRIDAINEPDKTIYHTTTTSPPSTVKLERSYSPAKQNGFQHLSTEDRQNLIAHQPHAAAFYPHYNLTVPHNLIPQSPHTAHLNSALTYNYIPQNFPNIHMTTNGLESGDHQVNLTTTTLGPAIVTAGLFPPTLPGGTPQIAYGPGANLIPQNSLYSQANSPEYDVPRSSNLSSPYPMGNTHNRLTLSNLDSSVGVGDRKAHLTNGLSTMM